MFGVVPKRMWDKLNPPDENNMCTWAMRCLLVETGDRKILIDTGIGNKQDDKFRSHFSPFGADSLFGSLEKIGLDREDITDVFLTHLHFDHCGGALWKNPATGEIEPAFPGATYWSNRVHWDWATKPNAREKASFLPENFVPLLEQGRLNWIPVEEEVNFLPGFNVRFSYGHTEAMMMPVLTIGDKKLIYCADLMPSQWHIGMPYVMAYDVRPLATLEEKERLLASAARHGDLLFFEHDPRAECGTVKTDEKGRVVPERIGALADLLG